MKTKKFMSLLMAIMVLVSVIALAACAKKHDPTEGLKFELNEDGESYSVVGIGDATDVEIYIPSSYDDKPVTSIGEDAFWDEKTITKVVIPDTVTSIGESAFESSSLTEISIPSSVTEIGDWAFCDTAIKSISIPKSVSKIGVSIVAECANLEKIEVDKNNAYFVSKGNCLIEVSTKTIIAGCNKSVIPSDGSATAIAYRAFQGCNELVNVVIPEGITTVGQDAFSYCEKLESISYPKSVTKLEGEQFCGCVELKNVSVDKENPCYYSEENCIIETSTKTLVAGCGAATIPNGVMIIGDFAFFECEKLTSVIIPDSVTTIGKYAFDGCENLTRVEFGSGIVTIGECAFEYCNNLEEIKLPQGLANILDDAFYGCSSVAEITVPGSVQNIGEDAFAKCDSLSKVVIENGVTSIGEYAFWENKSLFSVAIPGSVKTISEGAFYYCPSFEQVELSEGIEEIGDYAFEDCLIKCVVIPSSVKSIGDFAFGYSWDEENETHIKLYDTVIYCYSETKGEEYAIENGFTYYIYSTYKPTEEGNFWHYDSGKPAAWDGHVEHFSAVSFTGKSQEGRPLSYTYNKEDEQTLVHLMAECDRLQEEGKDYETFNDYYKTINELKRKLYIAREYEELVYYIYSNLENLTNKNNISNLLVDYDQWYDSMVHKIASGSFKEEFFEGMTDEEIQAWIGQSYPDEYYEAKKEMNDVITEYYLIDDVYDNKNFVAIEKLYVRYVKAANTMARILGYDNYLEYSYKNVYGRDYDVEKTDEFIEYVKQYAIPAYTKMEEETNYELNRLDETDRNIFWDFYRDRDYFDSGFDEFYAFKKAMGGSYEEVFDGLWKENGLFYISYDCRAVTAFQYYLPDTVEPYLYFGKDYHDTFTIIHEFGHYLAACCGNGSLDMDLNETHSHGNEFLYVRYLADNGFFSDSLAKVVEDYKVMDYTQFLIACALINEFEKRVYNDDDFTFDEADKYVKEINDYLGLDGDVFRLSAYWHVVAVDSAGYYISYATSLLGAEYLYKLAVDDFENAKEVYMKLIYYGEDNIAGHIGDVYAYAGLGDIFSEDTFIYVFR